MTTNIIQTITNTLDEFRQVLNTMKTEVWVLTPASGKALKNVKTGETFKRAVSLSSKAKVADFIEIDL